MMWRFGLIYIKAWISLLFSSIKKYSTLISTRNTAKLEGDFLVIPYFYQGALYSHKIHMKSMYIRMALVDSDENGEHPDSFPYSLLELEKLQNILVENGHVNEDLIN